jgi:multiple antibiotic resistance protein
MIEAFLKFFVVFFVVVSPISILPEFASLTDGATTAYKKRMAIKATVISALIVVLFAVAGTALLDAMGISIQSFRIFGGVLLFLVALEMVFARESGTRTSADEQAESRRRADISVFPLAFPLLAGPGALTTILLAFGRVSPWQEPLTFLVLLLAAWVVLAIAFVLMLSAERVTRLIGQTGSNVANRLLGVVLGALAVQFVVDGIRATFFAA